MCEITDATIPTSELKADHRVDENSTAMSVLSVDLIANIKREERLETPYLAGELCTSEDRDKWTFVKRPPFGNTYSDTKIDVAMDRRCQTALNIKGAIVVSCDDGLELKERRGGSR